jgi:hypothetical protein
MTIRHSPTLLKISAVFEVFLLAFVGAPLITLGIYRIFPGFESWQTEKLGFPFPVFVYVIMMALVWMVILIRHQKLADYGLNFRDLSYQLDLTAACFIPVVMANLPFGLGVDYTSWGGALILAVVQLGLLFILVRILRSKPSAENLGILGAGLIILTGIPQAAVSIPGKALALFLTYAIFVGFGEEILYRGYMQSRLNEVFGKPYHFFGVSYGWGAILTALFFGLTHVGILRWILELSTGITLAWGFWTIFNGLVFGYVREKSGSILASALLHGLPQAIATVVMLFL